MQDIPTDLLRTLVTVVDQKSFTRAGEVLGLTQPAISAQMKRLQAILGNDLFDRSSRTLALTQKGEVIVNYARRLLSINDLILHVADPRPAAQTIRVGVPVDFVGVRLPRTLVEFRKRWPDVRFSVRQGTHEELVRDIRRGALDLAVSFTASGPESDARYCWSEPIAWVRGRATRLDPRAPVPLVAFCENCTYHRTAERALHEAGRGSELVFTAPTLASLTTAVDAGLGIMALSFNRATMTDLHIWDDAPLPPLPDLSWAIYLREGADTGPFEDLALLTAEWARRERQDRIQLMRRSSAAGRNDGSNAWLGVG